MKSYLLAILLAVALCKIYPIKKDISIRNMNFNENWEFKFGADTQWKQLDLPHDFSIFQDFDENMEGESGFLPGGEGNYRKKFTLQKPEEDAKVIIYFYGSYKDTVITINGKYVGENHYGYNSFAFDITSFITFGQENEIDVTVTNDIPSSRWYSGSGIFRDVELIITGMVHIDVDGLKITTPDIASKKGTVVVEAEIKNEKQADENVKLSVKIFDKATGSQVASFESANAEKVTAGTVKVVQGTLEVSNPKLWSDVEPNLYTLKLEVLNGNNEAIDHYEQNFGFRYFRLDKGGFWVNDKISKLNGVSNHHDHGAIGSVDNKDAVYRKFRQLKDMGMNSIRTTHNIASKHWINIADEIGIYIIEELFDGWRYSKNGNPNDFGKYFEVKIEDNNPIYGKEPNMLWYEFCVKCGIKRDRNNPSIVMWSLGNELATGASIDEKYPVYCQTMMDIGLKFDTTRFFTDGDNNSWHGAGNPHYVKIAELIHQYGGVEGYNYAYGGDLQKAVDKYGRVYNSESASAVNSRGIYKVFKNQEHDGKFHLTSYDTSYVSWGFSAHRNIWITLTNDFVSGQFCWTGHDYIGEPTPWNGISPGSQTGQGPIPNSAYFGIIDTCGYPKDSYYLYRAQQNHNSNTVHLVTAWDDRNMYWVDQAKNTTSVWVYTNAQIVQIFRSDSDKVLCFMTRRKEITQSGIEYYTYTGTTNDQQLCEVVNDPGDNGSTLYGRFNIVFMKDTKLYTKAYDESGKLIDEKTIVGNYFAQAPNLSKLQIKATTDKATIKADGHSLAYIEIAITDDANILDTVAENLLQFKLEGEGRILGVDNGDQATTKKFQQKSVLFDEKNAQINCFSGRALVILSSTKTAGNIKLNISSDGLSAVSVDIKTEQ